MAKGQLGEMFKFSLRRLPKENQNGKRYLYNEEPQLQVSDLTIA